MRDPEIKFFVTMASVSFRLEEIDKIPRKNDVQRH